MEKINDYDSFNEAMRTKDLSSIPGKSPGERDYISDVSARAKERLGISQNREGDPRAIMGVIGPLMTEVGRSQELSRGHERELEKLATDVITDLYKPLIDYYNIKLDIKFSSGREIRNMIDAGYEKQKSNKPNTPSQTPIIKARGVDFSMLIHEAVKGMWRVLSMVSVPKDRDLAKAIESQFDLLDEPDEWKYGPEIAADLRDFINENPKIDSYKNVREELWKYMVDERILPTEKFLSLMKGILSKTSEARAQIDRLIDRVIEDIKKRDQYLKDLKAYELEMEAYERKMAEYKKKKEGSTKSTEPKKQAPEEKDYSKMSPSQLDDELSKALDERDFVKAREISKYLK